MDKKNILDHFAEMTDPREDNRWHKLLDIIAIVICSSICGADKWDDVEEFGKAKYDWLNTFLDLGHGIPSSDTYRRVFARLDPQVFNKCFFSWIKAINPKCKNEIISIDGKTCRHSYDTANDKSAIHVVSAWANKAGLTLGQVKVNEKSNEITAIPELIDALDVENSIITIDAMGTQKKIVSKIVKKKADYIIALKGNQGTLKDDVELYFNETSDSDLKKKPFSYYSTFNNDHGRIENREYWATEDIDWLSMKNDWEGLRSICMVKSKITEKNKTSSETRFFISSLIPDASVIGKGIRAHWGIENSLHWVLDMAFREDECRKRIDNSAENFAILRHITLNLLKQEKTCKRSIAGKRLLAGWNVKYLEKILFQV